MIVENYTLGSNIAGQRIRHKTILFGKEYFWMSDIDNTLYLLPVDEDGKPNFAV